MIKGSLLVGRLRRGRRRGWMRDMRKPRSCRRFLRRLRVGAVGGGRGRRGGGGGGGVGAIWIEGPGVGNFLSKHFSATPRQGRCVHGRLMEGDVVVDDPVVVLCDEGGTADLNVHGGPWIVQKTITLL